MTSKIWFFFFEKAKLAHLNWHFRESNTRPWGDAYFHVASQYHQTNPSDFQILKLKMKIKQMTPKN